MATKNKNSSIESFQHLLTKRSTMFWIISSCLIFFFLFMPFQSGLLNGSQPTDEINILYSFIIGALLLICIGIHMYQSRNNSIVHTPLQYVIWSIPLIYGISMFGAVSTHYSYLEFMIWIFYAILFMTAYHLLRQNDGQHIAFYIYMGSSSVIVLFGMMNWFGNASLWGLLPWEVYQDAAWNSGIDIRLASVFQYANTYAAYLIAFLFACLFTIVSSKNKYIVLFASFMFVPALISFILTLSRGGWTIFPVILILVLPLLTFSKQIQALFQLVLALVASVIMLPSMNSYGLLLQQNHTQGSALLAWGILLGGSLVTAVIAFAFQKYVATRLEQKLQSFNKRKWIMFLIPIVGIIAAIAGAYLLLGNTGFTKLLPASIGDRIANINFNQHSVLERGTFYKDALSIWKDYPIDGAGGGAWQALYQQYQNNPYTSSLAHSFFIQMLVEVGALGMLALFMTLAIVYYYFFKAYIKKTDDEKLIPSIWYIVVTSILIHSVLDFNMSYIYLGALVFFCLGAMLSSSEARTFQWQTKVRFIKIRTAAPFILIVGACGFLIITMINISGYNAYRDVQQAIQTQSVEQSLEQLNTAIDRGGNPAYSEFKVQVLIQTYELTYEEHYATEAQRILNAMNKNEPYYEKFIYRQLDLNKLLHKDEDSAVVIKDAIEKYPWEIDLYVELARTQFRRSVAALEQDDPQSAKQYLQSIIDLRDEVLTKALELENLPDAQLQGRAFGITPKLAMPIGQAFYVLGDYVQAESYLALAWNPAFNDNNDTMAALYYSAVLQKLNRPSEEINAVIFSAFADRQDELQAILDGLIAALPINN
ncbi:MAG: O-antigen ligase family protein [Candidatus Pristimantibacillus lignocellulolyticus]|uniref:O-antigen ligase family protein n=1 Tax=Candidatus Pristimantibacillus lignocellulolyticus TaxID=2994561 RepID=A0A9J6ZGW7_9BACL|nr:MAG: O-antigen ligase family protein [Candidatus Pristimantibacillus lignocellulolyticus]